VAQEDSRKPVDLRILVDISTGIKTSYPEARYLDGLQLLIDRLPQGSKAGIWSYGKYVNHLVKHASVTPAWRSYAKQQLNTVKHVALHRNIVSVVRKASFYNPKVSGYQRVILLLSGGENNLYSDAVGNQLERQKLLNKMLPKLRSAGFIVHTIAMSDKSDQSLLTTLAKETGGFSFTSVNVESFFSAVLALSQWIQPENYISADTLLLMVLFENVHVLNSRSETQSIFKQYFFGNPLLLFGMPCRAGHPHCRHVHARFERCLTNAACYPATMVNVAVYRVGFNCRR
jgi:hypothetical protein